MTEEEKGSIFESKTEEKEDYLKPEKTQASASVSKSYYIVKRFREEDPIDGTIVRVYKLIEDIDSIDEIVKIHQYIDDLLKNRYKEDEDMYANLYSGDLSVFEDLNSDGLEQIAKVIYASSIVKKIG